MSFINSIIFCLLLLSVSSCIEKKSNQISAHPETPTSDNVVSQSSTLGDLLYQDYTTEPQTDYQAEVNAIIDYIADKAWEVRRSSSGLYYAIHHLGEGPLIRRGDQVRAHYTGELLNGDVFDSSRKRGKPIWFTVGQMIPGWDEGMTYLSAGSEATFIVPAHLGYAEEGLPGFVPPNSTLVFHIEILD